jgi:hypothetical protein
MRMPAHIPNLIIPELTLEYNNHKFATKQVHAKWPSQDWNIFFKLKGTTKDNIAPKKREPSMQQHGDRSLLHHPAVVQAGKILSHPISKKKILPLCMDAE